MVAAGTPEQLPYARTLTRYYLAQMFHEKAKVPPSFRLLLFARPVHTWLLFAGEKDKGSSSTSSTPTLSKAWKGDGTSSKETFI